MRPTIDEILQGVETALTDVILPDLQSSFARSRARMAVRMVDYCRRLLTGQSEFLAVETAELRRLLAQAAGALDAAAPPAEPVPLAERLAAELSVSEPVGAEEAGEAYRRRRELLDETIRWLSDQPETAERLTPLRSAIRAYLRESLERELVLTGTRRVNLAP